MNNDKAYYETEEFWSTAPEGAQALLDERYFVKWMGEKEFWWDTFPDSEEYGYWDEQYVNPWPKWRYQNNESFSLIERPSSLKKEETIEVVHPWIPSVGEECRAEFKNGFSHEGVVKSITNEWVILDFGENGEIPFGYSYVTLTFKPIPKQKTIQEKMIDKWQRQSLDYAHDTTSSQYTLGYVFDFVVKNFNVEDK